MTGVRYVCERFPAKTGNNTRAGNCVLGKPKIAVAVAEHPYSTNTSY